jgi:hypothetical protein
MLVAAVIIGRTMPARPWLAGALIGGGAALSADATWRLMCPVSDPWHVLTAHAGAVVTVAVAGALLFTVVARVRRRSNRFE